MRTSARVLAIAALFALPAGASAMGHGKGKPQPIPCPADVAAAVAAQCPCPGTTQPDLSVAPWKNHGQYVRCVVHFRNTLRKSGCLTAAERQTTARCAARSTCGKDTVLCCTYDLGTCSDLMPGDGIKAGVCSNDPTVACDVSADCTKSTSRIEQDATACMAAGGIVVAGGGSVCAPCPPPPSPTTTTTTLVSSTTTTTL